MKVYTHIGYYNDTIDILDLFPNSTFKGDEADIVVKYWQKGYGAFHTVDFPDVDTYISPKEASEDKSIVFTSNGQYIVRFSGGSHELLRKGSDMHGFFIDIYALLENPDIEEEETPAEKDITEMTYDELYEYTLDLTKKVKEAVAELKRRESSR